MADQRVLQAFEQYQAGRLEAAAELLRDYLKLFSYDVSALHLVGVIYYRQGKLDGAREHLARACSAPGANSEMFNNYGAVLNASGDQPGAMAAYRRALSLDPNYADALSNLGVIYLAQGETRRAIEALRRAVALKPELTEAQLNLRNAYKDLVPPWHFAMINDRPRNNAYQDAIARAAPGKRVLDIGTGTGLLAMMAARAGAASVTTCEATREIAERAREIIALNGLADRISVVAKHSTDLVIARDLSERAQVLITETFSSDLLGEGVLPTIEHARRELLTADAVVVPRSAAAKGYLAGGSEIEGMLFAGRTNGFDLSPFNDFAPPILATTVSEIPHDILSEDFELFGFDFRTGEFPMGNRQLSIPVVKSGVAAVVVQWICFDLDDTGRYENRPSSHSGMENHWTQILYRLPQPLAVAAGDTVHLAVGHNRKQFLVRLV